MGTLTVDREALAVTEAAVAANLHQAGNILTHLAAKIALGGVMSVNKVTNLSDFFLCEVLDAGIYIDTSLVANLGCTSLTNAVKIGESDLNTLIAWQVDAVNTGQLGAPSLALTLLVARVLANHVNLTVATDDFALVAHLLYRRTYLHVSSFRFC